MPIPRRSPKKRVLRKHRTGAAPFVVGGIVLGVIAVLSYLGFTKDIPLRQGFQVKAVFETANSVRANSPVRIAGVNVGKVKKIERYEDTNTAVVTMEINDAGLPLHQDATFKVRPRIFLEGNFFVDVQPGTPNAGIVDDGDTIPMTQTAAPVQLGDVLTSLQADDRKNLQGLIQNFGAALSRKPTAADDAQADRSARGETAAQSLNDASVYAAPALRNVSIVNEAFLGLEEHDLSGVIKSLARVTAALGRNEPVLKDWVTNFNSTVEIFASEQESLQATIRDLAPTLEQANRTFASLNAAFPPTRAFAREFIPAVEETPATIEASYPWIRATRGLLQPAELQGLARDLSPTTRDLAKAIDGTVDLLPQQDLLAKCLDRVILPTGDIKIADGERSINTENYKEFWYTMVGLSGESQNFDGNGQYVRFQTGGGTQTISMGNSTLSGDQLFGRAPEKPLGTRPDYPQRRPPYKPNVACYTQGIPDLNSARTGPADASNPGNPATNNPLASIPGTPVTPPLNPTLPGVPGIPPPPGTRAQRDQSVTGALLDSLNPFVRAKAGGGK